MSILIKDMEMPKSCNECILSIEQACGLSGNIVPNYWARLDRPPWCELVELPPHGDLIDRKALSMTDFEIATCTLAKGNPYKNGLEYLLNKIENAPTIIEAETCNKSEDDGVNASIVGEE